MNNNSTKYANKNLLIVCALMGVLLSAMERIIQLNSTLITLSEELKTIGDTLIS